MAASRTLAAQGEAVEDSEWIVTNDLGYMVWCSMPDVSSNGATTTAKYGDVFEIRCDGAGGIEVVDFYGRRVCIVPPFSTLHLKAKDQDEFTDDSSNTRPVLSSWEVFGPGYQAGGKKGVHIADLAVTDGATTATTSALADSYVKATVQDEINADIDALSAEMLADLTTSFGECEEKINQIIAQLGYMGLTGDVDVTEGSDTLTLADNQDWQIVDDSELLVTSARAYPTYCTLPDIVAGGAGALTRLGSHIKISSTGGSSVTVRDFQHRYVCTVMDEEVKIIKPVLAASTSGYQWIVTDDVDSELTIAKTRVAWIDPLVVTLPTMAASAIVLAASYLDTDIEAAMDLALDGVFVTGATGLDVQLDTAFAQIETTVNAILVALETVTVVATS